MDFDMKNNILIRLPIALALIAILHSNAAAQLPTGWKQHDMKRPLPSVVDPGVGALPVPPPSDAIVLFDGKTLDGWRHPEGGPAKWVVREGAMEPIPNGGSVRSEMAFGDIQLHIEWASPAKVEGKSQSRGNSGIFLQSQFEVQVLDSFDNRTYADGQAGAIYGQYPPMVNASRKPGEWQSFDILFRAPKFHEDGKLLEAARITVLHNGIFVQDSVRPLGPTSWMQHHPYTKREAKLPITLQDHGNPVRFRNIWIRELGPETIEQPAESYDPIRVELTSAQQDKLIGKYNREGGGSYEVIKKEGKLFFTFGGPQLEMIPHSETEFGLRYTAGLLEFSLDREEKGKSLRFEMGGSLSKANRSSD